MFSVIVTTYNRPEALERVLAALQLQKYQDFEIVVADDGSGSDTKCDQCVDEEIKISYSPCLARR